MRAHAIMLVFSWALAGCGAKSGLLFSEDADGDADADGDTDADVDADGDGDADADADVDGELCGRQTCLPGEYCCSTEVCIDVGSCCSSDDCADGLACAPCDGCPGGAACRVSDLGCGLEELDVEPVPPNMMILLDRSGSMAAPIGGRTKWEIAISALEAVLPQYEVDVRFGLSMFPGPEASCTPAEIDVPVGELQADEVLDTLRASQPLVTTPIGDSLRDLRDDAGLDDPDRRNLVLLVSDGEESCGGEPITQTQYLADEEPSVSVYVVGFGLEVDDDTLTRIAETSGTERPGAGVPYWTADDQQALSDALTTIVRSVVPCGFGLHELPPDPDLVWVWLDEGTAIPRDRSHQDGWDLEPDTGVLTFYGPSCETIRTEQYRVQVVFGCPER